MEVLLTSDRAGVTWIQREGEIVDLPDHEARALIDAGSAILPEINQADEAPAEPAEPYQTKRQRNRRR